MPYNTDVESTSEVSFLADLSPNDSRWDIQKASSRKVAALYLHEEYANEAQAIHKCCDWLGFGTITDLLTGGMKLKLEDADFCRRRFCPSCQRRRSMKWRARFLEAVPKILKVYPKHRFIFLTLTIKNCELIELKSTIGKLNDAWTKLSRRKIFPGVGYIKCVEVTRSDDNTAHPHIHALIMVKPSYFSVGYISHEKWVQAWKSCLKIEYDPWVNVKPIRPLPNQTYEESVIKQIVEVTKYQVKVQDFVEVYPKKDKPVTKISAGKWLTELTKQLKNTRAISISGVLKDFISDEEPTEDPEADEESQQHDDQVIFGWRERYEKYTKK